MRRVILVGVALAACTTAGAASARPEEPVAFSATQIVRMPEGELERSQLYVSNGRRRMETRMFWVSRLPGQEVHVAVSLRLQGLYRKTLLDSEDRTAMDVDDPWTMPWPDCVRWLVVRGESPCIGRPELACERLGTERVDGHSTQRWRVVPTDPQRQWAAVTVWVAPALGGFILRTEEPTGLRTELTDIHLGPQPESLFQIPAGYQRVSGSPPEASGPPR
ncbi:hypothetical protein [Archangium violaceum]|uniref:hypothetical protein n=1 Tax=Archangium violaceum TaxID=83451 RepID=UPI00126A72CF|nr:hypothetical protein [Archangium violaceum]